MAKSALSLPNKYELHTSHMQSALATPIGGIDCRASGPIKGPPRTATLLFSRPSTGGWL